MNCYYGFPQMNTMTNSFEEVKMESVVCPKPRRYPSINRPFRRPFSYQSEIEDSGVGAELLDIIHPKGYTERPVSAADKLLASSPPYFIGSPPSRASNPVIQDERFGNGNGNFSSPFTMASVSPSARGCGVPMEFGNTQAAVRIEGFDCLRRDRRSISAVA
ncbi:unnamed protein product [Lathyrus oleraceus]|uniref:Uncharacterized protein n=1 Tax=Pisum sativum TaxID=3888 RepID=A0A9D4VHC2_PEA|nr:uncharacterized protein LOC127105799 [Pisum sativum]KAI5382909.1 hypothetical protein KIW84_070355 [Pisum sativum]